MLTASSPQPLNRPPQLPRQVLAILRWPFTHPYAALLWLALRLYLASVWFQFGMTKLSAGWLGSDPVSKIFTSIVAGHLRVPLPVFRDFAAFALESKLTWVLSQAIPLAELAVALAFVTGVLVIPASIGGIFLVVNVILSGISGLLFDGRVIVLHLLLIAAYQVASRIGFEGMLRRALHVDRKSVHGDVMTRL